MLAQTISCAVRGISGVPVTVEADVANGLPKFTVVGLTDQAIQEARERVRAAIRNSAFEFPQKRLTVNLAPAELPKEGTGFDLAIAVAVIATGGANLSTAGTAFLGELALDGSLRPVPGVLPMVRCLAARGVGKVVVAPENAREAARASSVEVIAVRSLARCVEHLTDGAPGDAFADGTAVTTEAAGPDLGEIRGQRQAKRALEIAAAGGHNLLMLGPPGSGKTMLARAFPSLLPDLTVEQALDVASIHSLRRGASGRDPHSPRPPFRSPHHSVSRAGLIGGGLGLAQPGEVSLASEGVLFLDEICEFNRDLLEALREPLEQRRISISRARGAVELPARFVLLAAANPCPCGFHGDPAAECTCPPDALRRYRARLSGPIRDRIDLRITVPRPTSSAVLNGVDEESSADVRARVAAARALQLERNAKRLNSELDGKALIGLADCVPAAQTLLITAGDRLQLSGRSLLRTLRMARTIADLDGSPRVGAQHIAEGLRYRMAFSA